MGLCLTCTDAYCGHAGENKTAKCDHWKSKEATATVSDLSSINYPITTQTTKQEEFETTSGGGKQAKIGEAFELIPPIPLMAVAGVFCSGRDKYGEGNWHNITAKNHIGRAIRHLYKWLSGDKEENHLANAVVRCLMAMEVSRKVQE